MEVDFKCKFSISEGEESDTKRPKTQNLTSAVIHVLTKCCVNVEGGRQMNAPGSAQNTSLSGGDGVQAVPSWGDICWVSGWKPQKDRSIAGAGPWLLC